MNFFKNFLASLLAVVVGMGLVSMISTMIFVGMIAALGSLGGKTTTPVPNEAVLRLDMGAVTDSKPNSPFEQFDFMTLSPSQNTTLLAAIRAIETASTDDRIKGIYMNLGESTTASISSIEEIRAALVKFKESGKFIVAYEEAYSQVGYYFASVADRVYLNPVGWVEWKGFAMPVTFYKGLLDKIGVQPVIVRHGSFKSAVEPFILDKMSPENRLQYETFAGSMWNFVVDAVAESRAIPTERLQKYADELALSVASDALDKGFVDGLRYESEVMNEIDYIIDNGLAAPAGETAPAAEDVASDAAVDGSVTDKPETPDVPVVSFQDYLADITAKSFNTSKNKIAVIYAEGDIVSGSGDMDQVGSIPMVEKFKKAREDKDVKAVVLRVNSPGGSAMASDVMWHELTLLKAEKPLIVSMGDYAASGGYYISCPADAIYADRTTLTGSIGVFGLYATAGKLADKLGVTMDVVNTNEHSDIYNLFRTPDAVELAHMQRGVEEFYSTFIGKVAQGRNMTAEAVDNVGQGRVWSGINALEIGLIDGFGGIAEAISLAADRVGIADDFCVWEVNDTPTGLAAFFAGFSANVKSAVRDYVMRDELGAAFAEYEHLRSTLSETGIQARLPYNVELK